jgi:hypothetical protein
MKSHEFTFGTTACEVHVVGASGVFVATPYVWENEGRALRALANASGNVVECPMTAEADALQRAKNYLEGRFGAEGAPPQRHRGRDSIRPILVPPLVDDRKA